MASPRALLSVLEQPSRSRIPSRDCDSVATTPRHWQHNFKDMKKSFALTALTAVLALGLSGCSLDLISPQPKPVPTAETSPSVEPDANSDAEASGEMLTQECLAGEPVTLAASDVSVEFTGTCGDVTVTGNNVYANFDAAGNISISGEYSSLGFTGSVLDVNIVGTGNSVFGNAMGAIDVGGSYNSVSASVATAIAASGSDNSISWLEGPADGTDTGTGNAFTGPAK